MKSQKLKDKYFIDKISRNTSKKLLDEYHYLHENGNFRSGINFGLFEIDTKMLIGVCVFHTVSAKEIVKGCFAIQSYKLDGFMELGRLCINPHKHEKNITSFFLSNSIKLLCKIKNVVALLTYADSDYHTGYIYQACNFKYYGLTSQKKDFFIYQNDGSYKKLQRGKCKHLTGEWRYKSQKHRYMIIYDKKLKTIWKEQLYPKLEQKASFNYVYSEKPIQEFIPIETSQFKLF
jgi:hypothetical protein